MGRLSEEEDFFIRKSKYGTYFILHLSDPRFMIWGNREEKTVKLCTDAYPSIKICDLKWIENRSKLAEQGESEYLLRKLEDWIRLTANSFHEMHGQITPLISC